MLYRVFSAPVAIDCYGWVACLESCFLKNSGHFHLDLGRMNY